MKKLIYCFFYCVLSNVNSYQIDEDVGADVDSKQLQEDHENDLFAEEYYYKENLWITELKNKIYAFYEALLENTDSYTKMKVLLQDFIYSHFLLKQKYDISILIYYETLFKIISKEFNYSSNTNHLKKSIIKNIVLPNKTEKIQLKNFNTIFNNLSKQQLLEIEKKIFKNNTKTVNKFINKYNQILRYNTEQRLDLVYNISTESDLEKINQDKLQYQKIIDNNDFKNKEYELLLMKNLHEKKIQTCKKNLKNFVKSEQSRVLEKAKDIYIKKIRSHKNENITENTELKKAKLPDAFYKLPKSLQETIKIARENLLKKGLYTSDDFIKNIVVSTKLTD